MKSLGAGRFPDGFRVNRDLAFGLDFRSLYTTAIDKWWEGDAKKRSRRKISRVGRIASLRCMRRERHCKNYANVGLRGIKKL
jgi:hypothetical protein